MADKKIFELSKRDLEECPVWYFPMDDTVDDELTIRPSMNNSNLDDYQVIVRTHFVADDESTYLGYIYWNIPSRIENLMPVLFVNNESCVTFWNGIVEASWEGYGDEQKTIRKKLPLTYTSDPINGLESITGVIEGLYYLYDNDIIIVK